MADHEQKPKGPTPRVVFLDDDIQIMGSTIKMIQDLGIELIATGSLAEAMKIIRDDTNVDGLITDLMMDPGELPNGTATTTDNGLLTGLRFAELVKSEMPNMPIIGISAARMPGIDIQESPFDQFISKATMFRNNELWSGIHEHFIARKLERSRDWVRDKLSASNLLLYEAKPDLLRSNQAEFQEQRQQILVSVNENLLRVLNGDMSRLPQLSPRQFEEVCAIALNRLGYDVTITMEGADEGVDLIAFSNDTILKPVYLVQCKRNRLDRKVRVPVIRDLRCVVDDYRASGGIVMTSSYFTSKAQEYADRDQYRMRLYDVLKLKKLIEDGAG